MHQSMGLLMRSMFVSPLLAVAALAVPVVACVDPEQDYNDYADRTADAHTPPPLPTFDAGETGPLYAPDASFSTNLFFMSCLTQQAQGNPSEASDFVAHVTYVPASSGGGGTLTFGNHVLKSYPTSLNDIAPDGMFYSPDPATATVKADGTTTMTYGPTIIPGDANPVTDNKLTFSTTTLDFHIESETELCATISGVLTAPISGSVEGPCVFRLQPSASSPLPTLQLSDYHCP
jgi:hypothetical protein